MRLHKLYLTAATALVVATTASAGVNEILNYQVTFTIGDVSSDGLPILTGPQIPVGLITADGTWAQGNFDSTGDLTWTASGTNVVPTVTPPNNRFVTLGGSNGTSFYNAYDELVDGKRDYSADGESPDCLTAKNVFEYACSVTVGKSTSQRPTPVDDVGPAAIATGTVTVDTGTGTLTGTLTFTDRGDGLAFALRGGDGSPFNASQNQVSPQATLALNLTGSFSDTSWNVTGGTAAFLDPNFFCTASSFLTTLCQPSTVLGGFQTNGSTLSWINVPVFDAIENNPARVLLTTVPGAVLTATLAAGTITTSSGEYHRALGSNSGGCPNSLVYNAATTRFDCGSLTAGIFTVTGTQVFDTLPVATDDAATTLPVTPVVITVLTNDNPLGDAPVTVTITTPPTSGAAVVQPGNTVSYTPNAGATTDSFVYTLTDTDGDADTAAVAVTIDDQPVANDDTAATTITLPVNVSVLANDTGLVDAPVVVTITTPPAEGTATVGAGNVVTYTAGANAGTFPFTYTVTDSNADTDTALVTVTVGSTPPDTKPDSFTFLDQDGVDQGIEITSNAVTITGINTAAPIAVSGVGGTYSIGCTGTFTATAGTISNGQTVCVRHTSATSSGTAVTTTLTVGGAGAGNSTSDAFSSGTRRPGGSSSMGGTEGLLLGLSALLAAVRRRRLAASG